MVTDIIKNSTALMCLGEQGTEHIFKTIGTSLIVSYGELILNITCRHIFETNSLMPGQQYKVLITLDDKVDGIKRLVIEPLQGETIYHPLDTKDSSYDVAVTFIGMKQHFPKIPLMEIEPGFDIIPEMNISYYGYPIYILKPEYFLPGVDHKINGVYRTARVFKENVNMTLSNYQIQLLDITVAVCDEFTTESIFGASGSGVYNNDNRLVGLVCGEPSLTMERDHEKKKASGINIIPLSRVIETITSKFSKE